MARVSIYVPDDMKSEMDALEERANWSNVAQQVFGFEINRLKLPKEAVMSEVIERLRSSKIQHQKTSKTRGFEAGRSWAMKAASYPELKNMADLDFSDFLNDPRWSEGSAWEWMDQAMGINLHENCEESFFYDSNADKVEPEDDEYVEAFIEGAQQIWNEVADKL